MYRLVFRRGEWTRSLISRTAQRVRQPGVKVAPSIACALGNHRRCLSGVPSDDSSTRDKRISRTLYRQLLRWCQSVHTDGLPDDILKHFIPPYHLEAPEQLDPYRMELLKETSTGDDDVSNQTEDAVVVRRVLGLMPRRSECSRRHITSPIHSVTELRDMVRSIFRLNNVVESFAADDLVAYESLQHYQKKRRDTAFEVLKALNQLYSGELKVLNERHVRHMDREGVEFVVGQVVQHRQERWRGVVAAWDKHQQTSNNLSDDFSKTSLTTKDYKSLTAVDRVRYNVLLDVGDAYNLASMTGWSTADQSELVAVADQDLCRIRNKLVKDHFRSFDAASTRFVPDSLKSFSFPSDVSEQSLLQDLPLETRKLCADVIQGVRSFADYLEFTAKSEVFTSKSEAESVKTLSSELLETLLGDLKDISEGNVVPSRHRFDDLSLTTSAALHLRALLNLSQGILETMSQRRIALAAKDKLRFKVGDVVQHKKYGFRGVIMAWDPIPTVDVTRWDGLRGIENPNELPFYQVIPDQGDCIEAFGGERPWRYVCEENLELCPKDRNLIDVDLDLGWERQDGLYVAPAGVRFKYAADSEDNGLFERSLVRLEGEINQWQYQARNPNSEDITAREISLANMRRLLQVVDNMDDAATVQDTIKEMRKAHPDGELRSRLEQGIAAIVGGNAKKAREIYQQVVQEDAEYCEGWNKLATCEFMIGKHTEAIEATMRVLELDPTHYQAKNGLGLLHFERKEYREAAKCFRESLAMDPWSPVAAKLSVCIDLLDQVVLEDKMPL